MKSLLGHDGANGISSLLCALERGRAEQQTRNTGCEMRLFVPRSGDGKCGSGFAGNKVYGIARKREFAWSRCESPRINSSLARSLLRGFCDARRHCAVLLSGLLSQSESGPLLQNARLGAWESRPLA
jgi:hypothetical protein